jgi:hypothetical protein
MTQGFFGGFNPGNASAPQQAQPPQQASVQQYVPQQNQAPQPVSFNTTVRFAQSEQVQFGAEFDATPAGATRYPAFELGQHVIEVVQFDAKRGPNGEHFILEADVVESTNPAELGQRRSWVRGLNGRSRIPGIGEVKKFSAAFLGYNPSDPTFQQYEAAGIVSKLINEGMATGKMGASIGQEPQPIAKRRLRVNVTLGSPVPAAKRDDPTSKLFGVSRYKNVVFSPL